MTDGFMVPAPIICPDVLPNAIVEAWRELLADDEAAQQWKCYHWLERDASAGLLSQTIDCVKAAVAAAMQPGVFSAEWESVLGIETWAQLRSAGSPLHLHWDVDEVRGRDLDETACPWMSIVCYLASDGGPTLVVGQKPDDTWGRRRVHHALSWPNAGSVLAMPGDRLHGVLAEFGASTAGDPVRFTLILNLWKEPLAHSRPILSNMVPDAVPVSAPGMELPPRAMTTIVALLNEDDLVEGTEAEQAAEASSLAAAFASSPAAVPAVASFETRGVWLGMFDRKGVVELRLPPIDYDARGAGADMIEWCDLVSFEQEEGSAGT